MTSRGLLDTSVFIAQESGRALDAQNLPDEGLICVVTLAELQAGVLVAADTDTRARRLGSLERISAVTPLAVDAEAASEWARIRVRLHEAGRRMQVNDSWIAAVAAANSLAVYTQDADFDVLAQLGLLTVVRVSGLPTRGIGSVSLSSVTT